MKRNDNYSRFLRGSFKLSGRTSVKDFWKEFLDMMITIVVLSVIWMAAVVKFNPLASSWTFTGIPILWTLCMMIPLYSLTFRRFTDAGLPHILLYVVSLFLTWRLYLAPVIAAWSIAHQTSFAYMANNTDLVFTKFSLGPFALVPVTMSLILLFCLTPSKDKWQK